MRARGFTLLEVMVAVAILGLALTVILSAQSGLYSGSGYAGHVSVATGLARCRMSELEERLLRLGYPELNEDNEGACCDDGSQKDFTCSWKIEKPELPNLGAGSFGGDGGAFDAGGGSLSSPLSMLSAFSSQLSFNTPNSFSLSTDGGVSDLSSQLSQGSGMMASLAPMAMAMAYPALKPMLEASIRKITVSVKWHEGLRDRDLTVEQYVTHPLRGGFGASGSDGGTLDINNLLNALPKKTGGP